jgi:hypothetical protein
MAYMPTARIITADLSKVSGSRAKAWWFDPRRGKPALLGEFPTAGLKDFTPPGEGDWVLVLDDSGENLPAPGTP